MPLITTKEKLKQTVDQQEPTELEYLAATFNKFSSIHRLPYSWVLKYGSIWHRYKTYIDKNVDILDDVWVNFDYKKNNTSLNIEFNRVAFVFFFFFIIYFTKIVVISLAFCF